MVAITSSSVPATFQGHDSADIAQAILNYVIQHKGQGWPTTKQFAQLATISPIFSIATILQSTEWVRIIFCILWISTGLILLVFGWASIFWATNKRERLKEKVKKRSCSGTLLGGGVGGALVGFVFFSFFTIIVACVICVQKKQTVSATGLFALWLLPGLVGAVLGGHFDLARRVMTGLAGGPCTVIILTAMFGIHTLIIRAILVAVFTTVITAPLLFPRCTAIHFHLVNVCTSIVGIVTLLNGVALYAPPQSSSAAWLDLWVVLLASDSSSSQSSAIKKWGTPSFKGYIAGAVLGAIVGFLFEFFFHKHAAQDPQAAWNEYLGSYTQKVDTSPTVGDRAGWFEPPQSAWNKIGRLFASTAIYGNVPLTARPRRAGPAKFEALGKHDFEAASDSEYDSDHSSGNKKVAYARIGEQENDKVILKNDRGYSLPRPPSYRTDSQGASSTLSGTTANSETPITHVEKSLAVYRDGDASPSFVTPPPAFHSSASWSATAAVPATPSLINAISRIQVAQAQAKEWQEERKRVADTALYKEQPMSPIQAAKPLEANPNDNPAFNEWWSKEVKRSDK